jgi:uncharacterized secreted protein with C-terminal beta-propeller domain
MNLAEHHVPGSKDTYYIPDFVTADEETYLLRKVSIQSPTFPLEASVIGPATRRFRRHLSRNGSNFRIGGVLCFE